MKQPDASIVRITDPQGETHGTGFLVSADGRVVTCVHVVRGIEPCVAFPGGEPRPAQVIATDEAHDVAILQVEGVLPAGAEPARLGRSSGAHHRDFWSRGYRPLCGLEGVPAGGTVLDAVSETPGYPDVRHKPLVLQTQHVRGGMSGAPVYVPDQDVVVGMITSRWDSLKAGTGFADRDIALATPSEAIAALCYDIPLRLPRAVEEYLVAVAGFCRDLPYVSLRSDVPLEMLYVRQQMRAKKECPRPMFIGEALESHPRIVIVGGPGAGKSTLLRHLVQQSIEADMGSDHGGYSTIPILVSMRGLAERTGDLVTALREQIVAELGTRLPQPLPVNFLADWTAQTGMRWLIALDGLDEVIDSNRRRSLLLELAQAAWPPGACVILTTRPDEAITLPEGFTPFELLPFKAGQVEEFSQRWFGDEARARAFLRTLKSARLGALSSTPLLLTVAATVFEEATKSPDLSTSKMAAPGFYGKVPRSRLYGEFVRILLDEDAAPGRRMREQFCAHFRTDLGEKLFDCRHEVLECIALALQEGCSAQRRLGEFLQRTLRWSSRDAEAKASDVLKILAQQRTGLVVQRGDAYEFIHPTFRAYLSAHAIVHEHAYAAEQVWWYAISRWAEQNWRDTALFALSLLSDAGQDVTPWLERIWKYGGYWGWYFSWDALAEQVKVSQRLSDHIIDDLVARARDAVTWVSLGFRHPVAILSRLRAYPRAVEGIRSLAHERVWSLEATEMLDELGRTDALLALGCDEQMSRRVRKVALEALGRHADAHTLPDLENIAQTDSNEVVRQAARNAIKEIRQRLDLSSQMSEEKRM